MPLTAAILAGGRARRFGGLDKSALRVGGRTILERQMAELSRIAEEILVVGHAAGQIAGHAQLREIEDLRPNAGPLGGLEAALASAHHDMTAVVACDMPYISAPLLTYLAALASEAEAVVPRTERGYHPLCAVYRRSAIEPLARHLAAGRLKMTDFIEDVKLRVVAPEEIAMFGDPDRLLANVNTPAEYDELEALHAHEVSS